MINLPLTKNQINIISKTNSYDKLCHLLKIINHHSNIIVTGRTGSGKTELAKILTQLTNDDFVVFTEYLNEEWPDNPENSLILYSKDELKSPSPSHKIILIDEIPNGFTINLFHQIEKLIPDTNRTVILFSQSSERIPKEFLILMERSNKIMCEVFMGDNFIDKVTQGCPDSDL